MGNVVIKFKAGDSWCVSDVEEYREIAGVGDSAFIELKFSNGKSIHVATSEVRAIGFDNDFRKVEEYEYEW